MELMFVGSTKILKFENWKVYTCSQETQKFIYQVSYKNMVYICDGCLRNFDSPKGSNIHRSHCKSKNNVSVRSYQINITGDNDDIINSHIETGDIVNTNEMNIVHEKSEIFAYLPSFIEAKKCAETLTNSTKGEVQAKDINPAYDEIIHWKKNLFKVSSGKSGKNFTLELAKWLEHYNNTKSNYQNITLKVFMILPALLFQNTLQTSKAKKS